MPHLSRLFVAPDQSSPQHDDELPLIGLKVLHIGVGAAGRGACRRLCDLGARVLEIISVDQEAMERTTSNPVADLLDRGKRRMALDWQRSEDRETIAALVMRADVVVSDDDGDTVPGIREGVVHATIRGSRALGARRLEIGELAAASNAVHGILAALVRRCMTGEGAMVETGTCSSLAELSQIAAIVGPEAVAADQTPALPAGLSFGPSVAARRR